MILDKYVQELDSILEGINCDKEFFYKLILNQLEKEDGTKEETLKSLFESIVVMENRLFLLKCKMITENLE